MGLFYGCFCFGCLKKNPNKGCATTATATSVSKYYHIVCVVMSSWPRSFDCQWKARCFLTRGFLPQCTWYRALWIECKMPTQQLPQLLQKVQDEVHVLKLP
jgi:hypothetical protein